MTAWRSGIKRDKYDALFSELVRMRTNWICECCKRSFAHNKGALHCSHIFGRRKQSVRLHPDNAMAHCISCHQKLGENPIEFANAVQGLVGRVKYERLTILANTPTKFTKFDKEIIHKHYLAERKRIQALRDAGELGRLEFSLP